MRNRTTILAAGLLGATMLIAGCASSSTDTGQSAADEPAASGAVTGATAGAETGAAAAAASNVRGAAVGASAAQFAGTIDTTADLSLPPELVPTWQDAATKCDDITARFLAAETYALTGWDADAVSPGGHAEGIAQLTPEQGDKYLRDVDGNGEASPFDPADAIDALATIHCEDAQTLRERGVEPTPSVLVAAYTAGVDKYDLDAPETRASVDRFEVLDEFFPVEF